MVYITVGLPACLRNERFFSTVGTSAFVGIAFLPIMLGDTSAVLDGVKVCLRRLRLNKKPSCNQSIALQPPISLFRVVVF